MEVSNKHREEVMHFRTRFPRMGNSTTKEEKIKAKGSAIMMIKFLRTISHAYVADKTAKVSLHQKEINKQKTPQEKLYILDLSGFQEQDDHDMTDFYEPVDLLDLSQEAEEHLWGNIMADIEAQRAESDDEGSGIKDETRRLTRMLVSARTQLDVLEVLSQAHNNKVELLMAAAHGDEKAKMILRRLDRLIRRGHRKMRDLATELQLLQKQQRAEKKEQEQLARKLREELKRAQLERRQRERKYLQDRDEDDEEDGPGLPAPSLAATEAKIMALAQAMASLTGNAGAGDVGGDASASFGDSSAFAGDGGDFGAAVAGGEVAVEIA